MVCTCIYLIGIFAFLSVLKASYGRKIKQRKNISTPIHLEPYKMVQDKNNEFLRKWKKYIHDFPWMWKWWEKNILNMTITNLRIWRINTVTLLHFEQQENRIRIPLSPEIFICWMGFFSENLVGGNKNKCQKKVA